MGLCCLHRPSVPSDDPPGLRTPTQRSGGSCARRAFAQLSVVSHLLPYLDQEALLNVNHVLVTSHLGFSNEFYMELPLKGIQKLHLVQNAVG